MFEETSLAVSSANTWRFLATFFLFLVVILSSRRVRLLLFSSNRPRCGIEIGSFIGEMLSL